MNMEESSKRRKNMIPLRLKVAIILSTCLGSAALIFFFWHVLVVIRPKRWPPIDFHKKKDPQRLAPWEVLVCGSLPVIVWMVRWKCASVLNAALIHKRKTAAYLFLAFSLVSVVWVLFLEQIVFPPPCKGWIRTDVGFIDGHEGWGLNMHTICNGRAWEPHVADAISDYLYGQGRAMDVGAFIGYHTMRLAKQAAPFEVYAIEGRMGVALSKNIRRNNAKNVQVIQEKIDTDWKLPSNIEMDLLNEDKGPLAFIKIDCEGCELHFLKAAHAVLDKWKPAMVLEIQGDESRQGATLGGQQMVKPAGTRYDVLNYLREDQGYTVTPLLDKDGTPSWDYLALWLEDSKNKTNHQGLAVQQ